MKNFFKFAERDTSYKKETLAGITTFLSIAYILIVNPIILSQTGMDAGAVFTATALTAIVGTLLMGLLGNFPFAMAPSMGLNAFFTYTVVMGMGIEWQVALTGVFVASIIFVLLSLFKIREIIINAIPADLKYAIAAGLGFFIAFLGLKTGGIIVANPATIGAIGDLTNPKTLLAILAIFLTVIMLVKGIRGGIFYAIIITTIVGIIFGQVEMPASIVSSIPSMGSTFGEVFFHLDEIFTPEMFTVILTFLIVAFFDTAGALIGLTSQAGMLKNNKIPNIGKGLLADSLAGVFGAIFGTSTPATSVESSAGISVGGRTGFTAVVIAACFAVALFFSPLVGIVLSEITAAALIVVGAFMAMEVRNISWVKLEIAIPAFLTIIMMPLTSSVVVGIGLGFIFYPVALIAQKRAKEVHPIMYVLCLLFLAYFAFII